MTSIRSAWAVPGWPTPGFAETDLWCYTDRNSYTAGDIVSLHVSSTYPEFGLTVIRDGYKPETVLREKSVKAEFAPTPSDSYMTGCDWPVAHSFTIPAEWISGFYLVIVRSGPVERVHYFIVRATEPAAPLVLVHTTSTLTAYNDWGGANHYRKDGDDPYEQVGSPVLSLHRPISPGFLRKPVNAPRMSAAEPLPRFAPPRRYAFEWARFNDCSRHHASAGWATYERPFVVWAEGAGYLIDHVTQEDLQRDPHVLDGYRCVVVVGHDEYWSGSMRDAVDAVVDSGRNIARFGGNFAWQIRVDLSAATQSCYRTPRADPLTPKTTLWDWPGNERPAATTFGLTCLGGAYVRYGSAAPRGCPGLTVYRPDHWVFEGTDMYFGEIIGAAADIASFEVDGVDFTFRKGLPYPTGADGAPPTLEILAMTPAVMGEEDRWNGEVPLSGNSSELYEITAELFDPVPEHLQGPRYGAGMLASFTRNGGIVVNTGTTEWVNGLLVGDEVIEKITHNVLNRLSSEGDELQPLRKVHGGIDKTDSTSG